MLKIDSKKKKKIQTAEGQPKTTAVFQIVKKTVHLNIKLIVKLYIKLL